MAENSNIEWTHHTFNPWTGCTKISPACDHCYAASLAARFRRAKWGPHAERVLASESTWKQPMKWNRDAEAQQRRARVFCLSMGDLFEKRTELEAPRARLWALIEQTPWLDWLLLTKRPGNVLSMVPWRGEWPMNIWIGTTAENQKWAERRIPLLLGIPATVRFVSAEPLLEPLDLTNWLARPGTTMPGIDLVIAGGESGAGSRPMDPAWARSLRDQCNEALVPFFFKQWGMWGPADGSGSQLVRLGKKNAGRLLDGRTWDELAAVTGALGERERPESAKEIGDQR